VITSCIARDTALKMFIVGIGLIRLTAAIAFLASETVQKGLKP
jgi:hypothetical protein